MALTLDHGGLGRLTDAGRKWFVPDPPVPAQTGQCAAAVKTVSRVARVQNMGVGEMAVVLDFVAVTGDTRFLAADKVKTWRRSSKDGERYLNIRTSVCGTSRAAEDFWLGTAVECHHNTWAVKCCSVSNVLSRWSASSRPWWLVGDFLPSSLFF